MRKSFIRSLDDPSAAGNEPMRTASGGGFGVPTFGGQKCVCISIPAQLTPLRPRSLQDAFRSQLATWDGAEEATASRLHREWRILRR